jgi:hypothetical protein
MARYDTVRLMTMGGSEPGQTWEKGGWEKVPVFSFFLVAVFYFVGVV